MKTSNSYHAHHSPMGAHSSFTVGMFGAEGGMALEKGGPAQGSVFAGYKNATGVIHYLLFSQKHIERFGLAIED